MQINMEENKRNWDFSIYIRFLEELHKSMQQGTMERIHRNYQEGMIEVGMSLLSLLSFQVAYPLHFQIHRIALYFLCLRFCI